MLTNLGVLAGAGATHLHGGSTYVRAFERPSGPPGGARVPGSSTRPRGCRRRRRRTTRLRRGGAQALGSSLRRRRRPPARARAERGSARTTVTRLRTARSRVGVRRAGTGLLSHRSSFPGRDAGQSPSPAMTPVNLLYLLPTPCHRPASSSPVLAVLLPTPRRRPTSSACTRRRAAGQPRPPAPHSAPPVSFSQRHASGRAPPPRALLSSSTRV
jgi:hypothetical protein